MDRTVRLPMVPARPLLLLMASQAVIALAGLVYGKLTALYIPPDEWGTYGLLLAAMTLLHGFFVTPTLQSFKAAFGQFPVKPVVYFYSRMLVLIYLTVAPATLLASLYYQNSLFILIWIAAVGQGVYQFGNDYLNALGRHRAYSLVQIGYAFGSLLIFSILVIGFSEHTTTGLWQSLALLNMIFAMLACWRLTGNRRVTEFIPNTAANRAELFQAYGHYAGPLLSLAFWNWLINYADRYLIRLYLTDADVGQYAMGYSVGSKLLVLVAPLLAFLSPQVMQLRAAGQPSNTANPLLLRYLFGYILVASAACLIVYVARDWVGQLLLSDRYEPAFIIGPIVAVGYLFLTSIHLLEVKWYAFGQTRFVLWHTLAGAALNLGLNLLLIPRLSIVGAALATMLGFAGQFLLAIWLFTRVKSRVQ